MKRTYRKRNYKKYYDLIKENLEKGYFDLSTISEDLIDKEISKSMIKRKVKIFVSDFQKISDEYKTPYFCKKALENNPNLINYIPDNILTEKFLIDFIKKGDEYKSYQMFERLDSKYKTKNLCKQVFEKFKDSQIYSISKLIPLELYDKELVLVAIENDIWALGNIPIEFLDQKICDDAVNRNVDLIKFVPNKFLTKDLCVAAAKKDKYLLIFVPKEKKTESFFLELVKNEISYLKTMPIEFLNKNLINSLDNKYLKEKKEAFLRLKKEKRSLLKNRILELIY